MQPLFNAAIRFAGILLLGTLVPGPVMGQEPRQLVVHLVQANNDSPYAFVRAAFEPGEVADPWAVRFFDARGREVPYFVWDSVTWQVAREGRSDWGNRFAILNHHPGDAPEAVQMRSRRLEAAKHQLPDLGAALAARDEAAKRSGNSVCAALYLVRHSVPAFGKGKLTLRIYPTRQIEPKRRTVEGNRVRERLTAATGGLAFENLPDRTALRWNGKELFRHGGFRVGDKSQGKDGSIAASNHADPARPFAIEIEEGIVTRLSVRSQSDGRSDTPANWQCTYWLFPEGAYVGLIGFSFDDTDGYLGGGLSMAVWEMPQQPQELHEPLWEKPWWLHQLGDDGFVAVHQFADTPLAVGYGNNPFNVSTPGSFHVRHGEKNKGRGDGVLELNWLYELTDKRVYRLFHPRLDSDGSYDLADITDIEETLRSSGTLTNVPQGTRGKDGRLIWPPERVRALEEALRFVQWRPKVDWLYRQYLAGVGESAEEAERGMRNVLGAAAGWVDRPVEADELAELIVRYSLRQSSQASAASGQQAWMVLPASLHEGDRNDVGAALVACADPVEIAAGAISMIQKHTAAGGAPIEGASKDGGEGWHNNPAYAAVDVPVGLRFIDHFGLYDLARHERPEYRAALLKWADFSLETLGGEPFDWDTFRISVRDLWPNRVVMLVPLMLRAYRETNDSKYSKAARLVFDELLMSQVETNPQGYFWAWGHAPRTAELFDTNYNMAAYDRGIVDFWSEEQLPVIGAERATGFVAAQARYLVISGQFLETLETDSMTAVQSHFPGGVPGALGQLALFLHDDFTFYRGLLGGPIRWGVIDDGGSVGRREGRRNFYTQKIGSRGAVFWAYGIGRDAPPSRTARDIVARWRDSESSTKK